MRHTAEATDAGSVSHLRNTASSSAYRLVTRSRCCCLPHVFDLCARCRGQRYCAGGCAREARRLAQWQAARRYQASHRGRLTHALRARRHRAHCA